MHGAYVAHPVAERRVSRFGGEALSSMKLFAISAGLALVVSSGAAWSEDIPEVSELLGADTHIVYGSIDLYEKGRPVGSQRD